MTDGIERFFAYARERHAVYLRRRATMPRSTWTSDPILQRYRFTNVFRELDRTTVWFRENVREKLPPEEILLATVVFRWFNRITTGEAIFVQPGLLSGKTVWELMEWSVERDGAERWLREMRNTILSYCGNGPYVTGSYIIKTPDGYTKLDGVLKCIEWFMEGDWREFNLDDDSKPQPLEDTWEWLRKFRYLGDFMAYEIVTDLRHSPMWDRAPDVMTWANPGPGATRGLGRILENNKNRYSQKTDKRFLIKCMEGLLALSRDAGFWPQWTGDGYSQNCEYDQQFQYEGAWPAWEMREVEHTLCEFDKYERVRLGEGTPRGRFN